MVTLTEDQRKEIGARIKQLRIGLNMTQDEFAKKCSVTTYYISRLENGHGSIGRGLIYAICETCKVGRDWILTGKHEDFELKKFFEKNRTVVKNETLDIDNELLEHVMGIREDPTNTAAIEQLKKTLNISSARAWTLLIKEVLRNEIKSK